ncbi:MAG: arginase family protein, partial [Candidatus Nanohaloarchaea archaeon]
KKKINGNISHDVVTRQLLKENFNEDEIKYIGVTKKDKDEKELLENRNLQIYTEADKALKEISDENPKYLSVDIDVLKKNIAPGTGYPDGKYNLDQLKNIIRNTDFRYADLVEVAPPLDEQNKTVEAAQEILQCLINSIDTN